MPFPDERSSTGVQVVAYRTQWADEFSDVADRLASALGPVALHIDHIGSTSIPGMAAKDCIDVQVRVVSLTESGIEHSMLANGFRRRPEPWNQRETSFGIESEKQVYAPPVGGRAINIHIRPVDSAGARYALLFREYLRSHPEVRDAWAAFKLRLAQSASDIYDYGQIKQPATTVLMEGARRWAEHTGWAPPTGSPH